LLALFRVRWIIPKLNKTILISLPRFFRGISICNTNYDTEDDNDNYYKDKNTHLTPEIKIICSQGLRQKQYFLLRHSEIVSDANF